MFSKYIENNIINTVKKILTSYQKGKIKVKIWAMGNKAKSIKSVTGTLTWLKPEGIKGEGKRTKNMSLTKQFAQAFLKLDTWCESTKGRSDNKVR